MRVVMPILEYHPVVGGAQRQLRSLAPLLEARGVDVHVITRAVQGEPAREHFEGAEVHRILAPGPKASASLVWTALALDRIRRLSPDVIHAYSLFSPATIAVASKRFFGVPSVLKILRGGEGGDVERLRRKTMAVRRSQAIIESVSRFVTISDEIEDELQGLGASPGQCIRITNGVDLERFSMADAHEKGAAREALGLGAGPVVAQCGRFVPEKRIEMLLDAWPKIRARHPQAELVLVGSGPCEADLRAKAGPGVHFLGSVDDVAPILQAADAFALPSRAEGLANAVLEAMASGLAVVATAVGGAVDVIDDGESGRLIPVDDEAALVSGLLEACDSQIGPTMGRFARQKMEKDFALDRVADRLALLYDEVSREGASHRSGQRNAATEEEAR